MASEDNPRVLMLSHCFSPNVGGVETHLDDLVAHLATGGIPATVLTYHPLVTRVRAPSCETRGCVRIRRMRWPGFGLFNRLEPHPALQFAYLFPRLYLGALCAMLRDRPRYTVIHAHGMVCAVIGAWLKPLFPRLRLVVSTHAVYGWLYGMERESRLGRFLAHTLNRADRVLTLARRSRDELAAIGVRPALLDVFTYWVDQAAFSPCPEVSRNTRAGWNVPHAAFTALFVGRFIEAKGLRLFAALAERMPDAFFVAAGDGPLRDWFEAETRRIPNLRYAGRIANCRLPAAYNAASVLCVPSQYDEGFGRVILESLSCGCPVVASRRGGIVEAMDDTVGRLTEPTVEGFEAALGELRKAPAALEVLRAEARAFALRRYGPANAVRIVNAYGASEFDNGPSCA